jgi:hypothetical protein
MSLVRRLCFILQRFISCLEIIFVMKILGITIGTAPKPLEERVDRLDFTTFSDLCSRYGVDVLTLGYPHMGLTESSAGLRSIVRYVDYFKVESVGGRAKLTFRYNYDDCAAGRNQNGLQERKKFTKVYSVYGRLPIDWGTWTKHL